MKPSADRVCFFTPSSSGGHALYTHELLSAMADAAHSAPRLGLITSVDLDARYNSDAYHVYRVTKPLRQRASFSNPLSWAASRVSHYVRRDLHLVKWLKTQPEISAVHFHEWTPWMAAWVFRQVRKMGKRVFQTVHNVKPHRYPTGIPKALVHRWHRSACREADVIFVLTHHLSDELSRFLGEGHPPIRVAPHGVWSVERPAVAQALATRLAAKRLLFFGQIRQNKGLHVLLTAMEHLPDYQLTIAGQPVDPAYYNERIAPQVARLRAAGANIDLRDRFVSDEEAAELFSSHGAVVMPYTEGFFAQSGVIFMALAHGLPAIASEAGGLAELFREFEVGVSYKGGASELAAAIRRLHEALDPKEIQHNIDDAVHHYSWDHAARVTLSGYASAFEERRETLDCLLPTTQAL